MWKFQPHIGTSYVVGCLSPTFPFPNNRLRSLNNFINAQPITQVCGYLNLWLKFTHIPYLCFMVWLMAYFIIFFMSYFLGRDQILPWHCPASSHHPLCLDLQSILPDQPLTFQLFIKQWEEYTFTMYRRIFYSSWMYQLVFGIIWNSKEANINAWERMHFQESEFKHGRKQYPSSMLFI